MNKSPLLKFVDLKTYIVGFLLALVFTILSFGIVKVYLYSGRTVDVYPLIIPAILIFALFQLIIQLVFFLHLVKEDKPRWNLMFFVSTFGLILLIVIASIWILNNLNYNMMSIDKTQYIINDEGINVDTGL